MFDFVRLAKFFFVSLILFDCVRQSNSIVPLNSIKFDCVRLPNVRLDTPGYKYDFFTVSKIKTRLSHWQKKKDTLDRQSRPDVMIKILGNFRQSRVPTMLSLTTQR